ncbi:MAG: DUF1624 domain-containing protein [Bacteriovoracaceae bacterium]|nr:DUF1624 domain-containing protein [Bacteriovoracaceae bacterium]
MNSKTRLQGLDTLRGVAVLLMLIFHFTYDLWLFGHVGNSFRTYFWYALPRFIVFLFLWCVGASLELVNGSGIKWKSFLKRFYKLAAISLIISVVTYFTFPRSWIYFGTIHCIATVSVLALPFFKFRWARLPTMILILIAQYFLGYDIAWVGRVIPRMSMDFIPAYPWFWVVLLGMITGPWLLKRWPEKMNINALSFLGRHALKIYLIHQALFYALFSLIAWWQKT